MGRKEAEWLLPIVDLLPTDGHPAPIVDLRPAAHPVSLPPSLRHITAVTLHVAAPTTYAASSSAGNYGWNDYGCSRWTGRSLLNRGLSQCTQQNWPMKNIDYRGDFGYLRRNGPYLIDMVCRRNYHWTCKYYLVIFHCLLVQWVWTSGWDTLQREVKGLVYQTQIPHVLVWFQAGTLGIKLFF
ncbi:hypothetical protein E3N88_09678 [Mikania micrantha]|uniref:Uncharacterized protein n=1 Tax=Mikania micrantha TaxID=192012 RepID=A0A5N6PKF1_9ASTR|nr:hypothetical protein E3N88_09678 [Mikania micrantha]